MMKANSHQTGKKVLTLENGQGEEIKSDVNMDVQSHLISNYKEALKNGDRSAARSCLLAAKLFSADDLIIINEIYLMAKHDNDIVEAAKCFSTIFDRLIVSKDKNVPDTSLDAIAVKDHLHEEIQALIDDLKSYYLKLKLKNLPTEEILEAYKKQSHSARPSVISFGGQPPPDSLKRPDPSSVQLNVGQEVRNFFYRQLFDNLPQQTKKDLLDYSLSSCDNLLEKCLLMIVAISVFKENIIKYGEQLLSILCGLRQLETTTSSEDSTSQHSTIVQDYAIRLLVQDAIPLVFVKDDLTIGLDWKVFEIERLILHVLAYYSEVCLANIADEHRFEALHDGLKRTIAARILGKENSSIGNNIERSILAVLDQLFARYTQIFSDNPEVFGQLNLVRSIISSRETDPSTKSEQLIEQLAKMNFDNIPMDFLENPAKEPPEADQARAATLTPPPKARGRPKKSQIASQSSQSDQDEKKLNQLRARQAHFVTYSLVQHMFSSATNYLRLTRSRVVLKFGNPLAALVESELLGKGSSLRSSRSKHLNSETGASPAKKSKIEISPAKPVELLKKDSPLNSIQSRTMDLEILRTLLGAFKCIDYLDTGDSEGVDDKSALRVIWHKLASVVVDCGQSRPHWFRRIVIDGLISTGHHDLAVERLEAILDGENNQQQRDEANKVDVKQLRALVQLISCHLQLSDRMGTYRHIDSLLSKIRQAHPGAIDESYSSGNMIDEHMVLIHDDSLQNLGFLFFDPLSMIRYSIDIVMDIVRRYVVCLNANSDTVIGHIITLSQFDWPKESAIYEQCTSWLRANKPKSTTPQSLSASTKFSYENFFTFIFNPNVIEDFMAMLNQGYTLDIKNQQVALPISQASSSSSQQRSSANSTATAVATRGSSGSSANSSATSTRSGKAITTRGVNKTFKEDLRLALVAQMKQSTSLIPLELISEFVQTILIPFLSSAKK